MEDLPIELLVRIFEYIYPFTATWARMQCVCKKWHTAANERRIFRNTKASLVGSPITERYPHYVRTLDVREVRNIAILVY